MKISSIIEFRSNQPMAKGHAITALPDDAKPGMREAALEDADGALDWYLARVAGRREHVAEAALIEAGFVVYLPRGVHWRRKGPDRERHEEAWAPGYLFVGLTAERAIEEVEKADRTVYRVIRLRKGNEPAPIAFRRPLERAEDPSIEAILRWELNGDFDHTRRSRHRDPVEGSPIPLIGGRFQGFPAKWVRRREDDRVDLLLHMFGRDVALVEQPHNVGGLEEAA